MKVGFVCTNYNNSRYTRGAIASLRRQPAGAEVPVVVVDNQSAPADVAGLRALTQEFVGVEVIYHDANAGYFPGLNIGIRHLRARSPDITHLLVGNNDLEFPAGLLDAIEAHPDIFEQWLVVAPDLLTLDGVHQNPHVRHPISRLRRKVWDLYFSSYPVGQLIRVAARLTRRLTVRPENRAGSELYRTAGPIEQGYGACYILGPAFFRHFTGLCAPSFLMQEEFFLGEQLALVGQRTYYDPRFQVVHHTHATMGQMPSRRHWEISRASHRVYQRYLAMAPDERREFIQQWSAAPA